MSASYALGQGTGPLNGVRVVELAGIGPGPHAAMILPRSFSLLRDAVDVLLEAVPADIDLGDVREHLRKVPGVVDVHDLHAWTITSGMPMLSVHVTVTDAVLESRGVGSLLDEFSECITSHFAVHHATFQIEPESHLSHEDLGQAHH